MIGFFWVPFLHMTLTQEWYRITKSPEGQKRKSRKKGFALDMIPLPFCPFPEQIGNLADCPCLFGFSHSFRQAAVATKR